MITEKQKNKILKVVSVFETGKPEGDYAAVTVMKDGHNQSYQVTYGKHQTTEQGNLKILLQMYIDNEGKFSTEMEEFVSLIGTQSLAFNMKFRNLLIKAAKEDKVMRDTQDAFFEEIYFSPALKFFEDKGFTEALSLLVIYDSYIHSGQIRMDLRRRFSEMPPVNGGNEKVWISSYVDVRHQWLKYHSNPLVRRTTYRTKCFREQIDNINWNLSQPVKANGVVIK